MTLKNFRLKLLKNSQKDGRLQIFNIHTEKMRTNGLLASDVDLKMMAEKTKNFSGAEIEARIEF